MHKFKSLISALIFICAFSNSATAQLLEAKSELDERAISIKVKDGVPSSRVIVSSSFALSYSSNMGDLAAKDVGSGIVNGLNSDTLYFYLMPDDPKRIVTISTDGYPSIDVPFTFSPKETYRCLIYDPNKKSEEEASPAANTSNWQYMMAQNFDFGRDGFNVDEVESLNWYEKAAEQGHGLAQVTLGVKYASGGDGFVKDAVKSARWFLIAAQQNYDTAQYAIANCFLQGNGVKQDSTKAYRWFQQAADKDIDEARYRMANMLLDGYGSEKQVDDLLSWLAFFANENRSEAQYMYSKLLLTRRSESLESYTIAVDYLNKAVALSHVDAMLLLGEMCLDKYCDQYNVIKGMELLRMAESVGSNEATKLIVQYDESLSNKERFIYTEHFADDGNGDDMVKLAYMYYNGLGTAHNYGFAVDYFIKAIGQGVIDAYTGLALCYYYGRGVSFDYDEAFYCFTEGSADGDSVALSGLGMCYFYGHGVEADAEKAYELFTKSNDGDNGTALNGLGLCYYHGRPVSQNTDRALALFQAAQYLDPYNAGLSLGDLYQVESQKEKEIEDAQMVKDYYIQQIKDYYTLAANAGNPEAQNKLGLFVIDNGYREERQAATRKSPEMVVSVPPTESDMEEARGWFAESAKRESLKGEYNHAYSLIMFLGPMSLTGSESGKQAVEVFRSAAEHGSTEAMVALSTLCKSDIGIEEVEAYNWLCKASGLTYGGENGVAYRGFLGAFMFDEAAAIAESKQITTLEVQSQSATIMEEAISYGCTFLFPRIYRYYKEVVVDKRKAKEWAKSAKLLTDQEKREPIKVMLQR